MIRLEIDNSKCTIVGLNESQFKQLRKKLSYIDSSYAAKKYNKFNNFPRPTYLITKKGQFPTGLLYLVEEFLKKSNLKVETIDKRVRPETGQFLIGQDMEDLLGYQSRPEQLQAAMKALSETRGIIVAPTGCGKSQIAAEIIRALKVPTLIVVPRLGLKQQLTEDLTKAFGYGWVGPLGPNGERKHEVTIENVDALDPKKLAEGFDCVIIDEFHRSAALTYRALNNKAWKNIYFKFGLTATPFRNNREEKLLLESVLSKVIYEIEYDTAVAKGYIVPMETYYYEMPPLPKKDGFRNVTKTQDFLEVYKEHIVERDDRNKLIADITENLLLEGKSTLVLVKQVEHGERLQKLLLDRGHDVPFAKGENDDNRPLVKGFNAQEFPVMIGTVGVLGEGIDTKPAEFIILAGGGKSKNAFMQNLGRGFRRFPGKQSAKIIMFNDCSHKWFQEHFKMCLSYLEEEYGIYPAKLE